MNEPKPQTPLTDAAESEAIRQFAQDQSWRGVLRHVWGEARSLELKLQEAERQRDEARKAERTTSDAYLRIRQLVKSWNTNFAGENRFEVTEQAIKDLQSELTQLRKVCDELADRLRITKQFNVLMIGTKEENNKALTNYSTLPHVIKAKGNKQ